MPDIARLDELGVLVAVETVSPPDHKDDPAARTVALPDGHDMRGRIGGYSYDWNSRSFWPLSTEPLDVAEREVPGFAEGLVDLALALEDAGVIRLPDTTRRAINAWLGGVDGQGRRGRRP